MERSVNKANDLTAFFTNGVNMKETRGIICKPHTQKFGRMHMIDRETIESEGEIWERSTVPSVSNSKNKNKSKTNRKPSM